MRNATNVSAVVATCWALACLWGCQAPPLPKAAWQMVVAQSDGRLALVMAETPRIFSEPKSVTVKPLPITLSRCLAGWLDPDSGVLATLEEDEHGTAVRVYDGTAKHLGEHRTSRGGPLPYGSCPVLFAGARRMVFIDPAGNVIVAEIAEGRGISARTVCRLTSAGVQPYSTVTWIDDANVGVESLERIYRVDLHAGTSRLLGSGSLLGLDGKNLVIARYPGGVSLLDMDGALHPFSGRNRRHHAGEAPYAGYRIHRVSPDCGYLAYDTSLWFTGRSMLAIQHLASGRRAYLQVPGGVMSLGSWSKTGDETGREQLGTYPTK